VSSAQLRGHPAHVNRILGVVIEELLNVEKFSAEERNELNFRHHIEYDTSNASHQLRLQWGKPPTIRGYSMIIDDFSTSEKEVDIRVAQSIRNLRLRNELYFLRLARHFPKTLLAAESHPRHQEVIIVRFKNGNVLEVREEQMESREFLAKCVMIHDL